MDVPDQAAIRRAVINSSRSKAASMTFPSTWPPPRADERDFIGWVDPKAPRRAYLVLGADLVDELTVVELRLPSSPGGRTRKTMCDLCQTSDSPAGVALLVAARAGLDVSEYAPTAVKSAITGDGSASKKQIQQMVARLLRLAEPPRPADAADALAIALCHLRAAPLERAR